MQAFSPLPRFPASLRREPLGAPAPEPNGPISAANHRYACGCSAMRVIALASTVGTNGGVVRFENRVQRRARSFRVMSGIGRRVCRVTEDSVGSEMLKFSYTQRRICEGWREEIPPPRLDYLQRSREGLASPIVSGTLGLGNMTSAELTRTMTQNHYI